MNDVIYLIDAKALHRNCDDWQEAHSTEQGAIESLQETARELTEQLYQDALTVDEYENDPDGAHRAALLEDMMSSSDYCSDSHYFRLVDTFDITIITLPLQS